MYILRIEHSVPDFNRWKLAFDNDPAGRERAGVRRYQILRSVEDPFYVMIDLEFENETEARALLASMRVVWGQVAGKIIMNPKATIVEVIETKEFVT
ncbi:MAG: hypothetical protein P4L50_23565 [Anaerolineaceae bacterium]|nr:hypothetical protein [Anaerolineaceae bacterium]